MRFIKENGKNTSGVSIRTGAALYLVLIFLYIFACFAGGCSRRLDMNAKRGEMEYTVCPWGHMPKELQSMVNTSKKKAGTFSYSNSKYTYLVICYGSQRYSGYSIQVIECSKGEDFVYLKTRLIGPAAGEPVVQKETWPYIVIRCDRWDGLCLMES